MEHTIFDVFVDLVEAFLKHQTVIAPIFLLTIEESGIPLPVPGDIIVAYSGYNISKGLLTYPLALISIMIAILMGSTILYRISYKWGNRLVGKFGKFWHIHPEKITVIERYF